MATLYWGGGTGNWDGFTTTNWYSDFGRTTLAGRAPSEEDDVVFDTASGTTYTVTVANDTAVCRDLNYTGASGSFTLSLSTSLSIYGSVIFTVGGTSIVSGSGNVTFYGTGSHTINDAGFGLSTNTFAGSGTYTLQRSAVFANLFVNAGTLDTNSQDITVSGSLGASSGTTAGTLILGASNVSAGTLQFNAPLTIVGGTSNITISSANSGIGGITNYVGNTFYNVTFSSSAINTCAIFGNNTFNNLTFTAPAAASINILTLYGDNTVNGTLTIAGQSSVNRYFVRSDTIGTARTLTVATVAALTDVDFRDITVAGASAPWSGTRLGNCLGNTNITFVAGVNKYIAAATTSSNWSANIWATSSGGAASAANFPLAQDTVIIDNAGLNTSTTLTINIGYNIGGLSTSTRTNATTLAGTSIVLSCYGSVTLSAAVTVTLTGTWTYAGRNTQTITTAGKSWTAVVVDSPGGTVQLVGASTFTGSGVSLNNGTFDSSSNTITVTAGSITATGSASKTLTLGSSTLVVGSGVGSATSISNLTVSANTASITASSAFTLGFNGITATFGGTVTPNGSTIITNVYGTTTVGALTLLAPPATTVTDKLILNGDLTVTGTLALAGSATITSRAFVRSGTLGTQRTLSAATVTGLTNIDFRDINATGAANWTTGTQLGDCGNNTGITFPAAKTVYWNLGANNAWSATAWAATSGGAPAAANFPLAQDTAVINDAGTVSTITMNSPWNIGTINAVGRTLTGTFAGTGAPTIYGNITYGSGITASVSGTFTFSGRGTQTFTTAGKTINGNININKPAGTFQHGDAYTIASTTQIIIVTAGSYATQNFNISIAGLSSSNASTRSITFGTSTVTATGTAPISFTNSTGLTFSGASSTINLSSTSAKTFAGGDQTFGTVSSTGGTTAPLTITGSNTFGTLTNSARTYLIFGSGTTQTVSTFTYSGASGAVVRWYTSIPGQQATISKTGAAVGFGANSTNGGNNVNMSFTGTTNNYFYVKDMIYVGASVVTGNFLMLFM